MKKEKTIPTLVGLAILAVSLIVGLLLTNDTRIFSSRASSDCSPKDLKITNISHYSATVSLTTNTECSVNLSLNGRIMADTLIQPDKTHYFELTNLNPNTDYTFDVISGGKSYKSDNYKIKTAVKPQSTTPTSRLAWGKVFYQDLRPAANSIVYLSIPSAAPLSGLVTNNGYWYISLATSFNKNLTDWFKLVDGVDETIEVLAPDLSRTIVSGNTSKNNPVPDIIIGQNVGLGGSFEQVTQVPLQKSLSVISPKEAEIITVRRPDIFGNAASHAIVVVNLGDIKDSVQAGSDGSWHWYPQVDLPPGSNQLKVVAGEETVVRNFIISVDSGSLAFTASESARLISPTSTPIPSTITSVFTPTPTQIATPTVTPSTSPRPTSTPAVRTAKPATDGGVPATGVILPTIGSLLGALTLIGIALVLRL
ncbi:MAG TPA: hypothetical protein P5299_00760 [Candidatus Woesebacteria bacterium]|nr:hypothetical protein [Candidatus Woesebacteria bacterium]